MVDCASCRWFGFIKQLFQITLENLKLHLNEDRPPVNITSPGPVPIDLQISQLYITRTEDGVFHIQLYKPLDMASTSSILLGKISI